MAELVEGFPMLVAVAVFLSVLFLVVVVVVGSVLVGAGGSAA